MYSWEECVLCDCWVVFCTCLLGPIGWYLQSPIRGDLHVFTGSFPNVCLRYCSLIGVDRNRGPTAPATVILSSVQFSYSVLSDTLKLQSARILCPSLTPRACSNSCPLSHWYYPAISSCVTPFSYCLQSFPASGSFAKSWLFASGGQSIGASTSTSVLPMNIQG